MRRKAFTALEVLIAGVIATFLGVATLGTIFQTNREATVSEDYMFAEAHAQRFMAELLSIPVGLFDEADLPMRGEIFGVPCQAGMPPIDKRLAAAYDEYRLNLEGPRALRGYHERDHVDDGLERLEVFLSWPVAPNTDATRNYVLLRLKTRMDVAITTRHRMRGSPTLSEADRRQRILAVLPPPPEVAP